jgi:hypothetical protein
MYQARQRWQPSVLLTMRLSTEFTAFYTSWDATKPTFRDMFWMVKYDTMLGKAQQISQNTHK